MMIIVSTIWVVFALDAYVTETVEPSSAVERPRSTLR